MTIALVMGVIAVVVVLVIITRNQSRVRKDAKADLEREIEAMQAPDIMELVKQEVEDTGVLGVPGSEGVDVTVLLQVWQRDVAVRESCADGLRFKTVEGTAAEAASADTVRLVCDGATARAEPGSGEDPATEPDEPTNESPEDQEQRDETAAND